MSLRFDIKYGTLTGMEQGIVPRFYLQFLELGKMTFGKIDIETKLEPVLEKVIPELESFYLKKNKIIAHISEYKDGVRNGKYFKATPGGGTTLDAKLETEIRGLTKEYTVQAKRILTNFIVSNFVDDRDHDFNLGTYLNASKDKLAILKAEYQKRKKSQKYLPLILVIEKANNAFLFEIKQLREDFEHDSFSVGEFVIQKGPDGVLITEPPLNGVPISEKVIFIYENLLSFLEKIMAYYVGINVEEISGGLGVLCVSDHFDYSEQRYKYTFAFGGVFSSPTARHCMYD